MASLNQIARTTRLGMTEGPAAPINLTPEQYARSAAGMKTALGIETAAAATGQLSAVAGARRSLSTEPKITIYNTLGQRINALESVKKIIADHYAQYDASKRNLARSQTEALAEKTRLEETRKTEQQRQQETSLAELARQQSTVTQQGEEQQAWRSQTAAEQQRQTQAESEKRLAENKKLAEEQYAQQKAAQKALQARATADLEAEAAAKQKQQDDFQAAKKAAQKAYEEKEKTPKRNYWENLIKTRQDNYMKSIGERDPNALVVYNPGLAENTAGPDRYTVEIPEFPEGLAPADDPNYKPPGGLPNLEDYLVDYDKSFSDIHPAYTRVFWQLKPEQRAGYLQAYIQDQELESSGNIRQTYLNGIGFELDPDKPLIKEPMPDWKPTPATPEPPDSRTQPQPPGSDQPGPVATPQPPRSYDLARERYLLDNPDVARAGVDPWQHYLSFGKSEGKVWPGEMGPGGTPPEPIAWEGPAAPTPMSYEDSVKKYLQDNPDVAAAGVDPWQHYNSSGRNEGRTWPGLYPQSYIGSTGGIIEPHPQAPGAALNYYQARDRYLQDNPDVARAGMDPWRHYSLYGKSEGRVWPGEEEPQSNNIE